MSTPRQIDITTDLQDDAGRRSTTGRSLIRSLLCCQEEADYAIANLPK